MNTKQFAILAIIIAIAICASVIFTVGNLGRPTGIYATSAETTTTAPVTDGWAMSCSTLQATVADYRSQVLNMYKGGSAMIDTGNNVIITGLLNYYSGIYNTRMSTNVAQAYYCG